MLHHQVQRLIGFHASSVLCRFTSKAFYFIPHTQKRALFICLLHRVVLWMLLHGNTNKYELKSSLRAYCIAALKLKSFYTVRTFLCHLLLFHLCPACFRILHKCLQWILGEYLCWSSRIDRKNIRFGVMSNEAGFHQWFCHFLAVWLWHLIKPLWVLVSSSV